MPRVTSSGWRRFFGLPCTRLGWASFVLLAAFFAIAIIGQGQLGIDTRWVNVACLVSSGITGLIALVFKHDRSWLVWMPVAFAVLAFGGEVVQALVGGGWGYESSASGRRMASAAATSPALYPVFS